MTSIAINPQSHKLLWSHLLPDNTEREQAAFMFAKTTDLSEGSQLVVEAIRLLNQDDFLIHRGDQIELADACRSSVIKEAHDRDAVLIEIHSHPFPWPAQFSYADYLGLRETVPHMLWRLPSRPYVALVAAPTGFDGLLWSESFAAPTPLNAMIVGSQRHIPSNLSMELWK